MNHSAPPSRELTHIGHYAIIDSIGRGGMGLVYLARDTRLDRLVAIKCLRTELIEPHYRERFKREALLLAKLNHPYIVQIYDFIETPEQLGLVMEFVDGQNLQRYLREQIAPFSQRMQWLTQIAQGLAVAHDAGIIHRDLKAENILINKRGEAKISDLGIAKSQDFNLTLTEHVTGSYASMSPEQAVGEELDFRSDLFSFGILAYQLLCGAHPFGDTDNKLQLLQRIISHPPTSPSSHNPDLPPEISDLLGQLLSKDPNKRPANTHWLAAQCEKLNQLTLASALTSDHTPLLLHKTPAPIATNSSSIGEAPSAFGKRYSTREHPTFDRRLQRASLGQRLLGHIQHHRLSTLITCVMLLAFAGLVFWQMQPKPPRYVAVLPPVLNSNHMQQSQQELVKAAVYDAIQQSLLQLDGYYLIPDNEIANINAGNNTEGLEIVRRATAADELLTADIQCQSEACTITLSRLTLDNQQQGSRLRVKETKKIDVLTDNYLSVATTIQNNVGDLYSERFSNAFAKVNEQDYAKFLDVNQRYRQKGAQQELLDILDNLQRPTKNLAAVQTLYTEIGLDLHYASKAPALLDKIESYLDASSSKNKNYLYNLFYLQIAQKNFADAGQTIASLTQLNASNSSINELYAYKSMAEKDYQAAIGFYKKSLEFKNTANNLFYMSTAYWYTGNIPAAKELTKKSLSLSPNYYKALTQQGLIALLEGNVDEAKSSFAKVTENNPDDAPNLINYGLCNLLQKNYEQAIDSFNQALRISPHSTSSQLNKADAENLSGNIEASKVLYKDLIKVISTERTSENLRSLAQAYAHLGQYSEALTALQQLENIDPQNIATTYAAALVHTLANNTASAILNIENTLKNGMNKIWFSFSWFDPLCKEEKFISIMKDHGEPNRCALLEAKN